MKKILAVAFLFFAIFLVSGCGSDADRNAIYDDDAKIAKSADSSYANMSVYSGGDNELSMSARTFTGAKTLWRYTAQNDCDVTFSYSLSVSNGGKAKLVLITPDGEVIILSENVDNTTTDEMQSQTVSLNKGNNRIKIVGYEDPSLNLILQVDVGELGEK